LKISIEVKDAKVKKVDDTSEKMEISRSAFIRMAINEKLFRLGISPSDEAVVNQQPTLSTKNEVTTNE
jgi:predicted transcriptional regulator